MTDTTVFTGRIIRLSLEHVTLPNARTLEMEIVHHPGGAAVVALDAEHRVALLRQYRHAVGGWVWELPAGKLDPGEAPALTARRELREEAGVSATDWTSLGHVISSPGVFTERVHLFLARGLQPVGAQPEEHEVFELHWLPLAQAVERAASGEFNDAKTLCGLFRAQHYLTQAHTSPDDLHTGIISGPV